MSETIATNAPPFWRDVLSAEERRELLEVSALRGWITILSNWFGVFAVLALVAWAPNPLTIVLALFIIGTRQLGMAVVMHEAAHRTLRVVSVCCSRRLRQLDQSGSKFVQVGTPIY